VVEVVADLVAIVEQKGLASQANAVSSTASPIDATSLTTDQNEHKEEKTGHSDAATYTNPGLGKMWNKDIYTGPGCLPCNTT
jgi:hypothetical protein